MTLHNRLNWIGGATRKSADGSSFGKGIEPRNLRLCEHGAAHVSLAGDWSGMAQGLHELGDVVASTLNDAAILTQRGRFPRFDLCPCGRFAVNGLGGLGFDFAEWRRLWATRRTTAGGVCHSLAIVGHDNRAAHQVLLADPAAEEVFAGFTRLHQGEPEERHHWPARGHELCAGYHERFRCRKWEFVESAKSGSRKLTTGCVGQLFEAALSARLCLTTTIVSAPVIQSSLWTPVALEQNGNRLAVTSESTQLRMDLSGVAEVWSVPPPEHMDGCFAVELYDAEDRLLLGLSVAAGHECAWLELLRTLPAA